MRRHQGQLSQQETLCAPKRKANLDSGCRLLLCCNAAAHSMPPPVPLDGDGPLQAQESVVRWQSPQALLHPHTSNSLSAAQAHQALDSHSHLAQLAELPPGHPAPECRLYCDRRRLLLQESLPLAVPPPPGLDGGGGSMLGQEACSRLVAAVVPLNCDGRLRAPSAMGRNLEGAVTPLIS